MVFLVCVRIISWNSLLHIRHAFIWSIGLDGSCAASLQPITWASSRRGASSELPPSVHWPLLFTSSQGWNNEFTQSKWQKRSRTVLLFLPSQQERNWEPWIIMLSHWLFQSWLQDSQGHMTLRPVWKWPPPWSPTARAPGFHRLVETRVKGRVMFRLMEERIQIT